MRDAARRRVGATVGVPAVLLAVGFCAAGAAGPASTWHETPQENHAGRDGALPASRQGFQCGFCFVHSMDPERGYGSPAASSSLRSLRQVGTNWVSIHPFGFSPRRGATTIDTTPPEPGCATQDEIRNTIRAAKLSGLRVLLKPQIWFIEGGGHYSLGIEGLAAWSAWFEAYERFLLGYAEMAAEEGVDGLVVGVELPEATLTFPVRWRLLIDRVREVYAGPLVYSAFWPREAEGIAFWDALDWVGVNHYVPLVRGEGGGLEEMLDRAETEADRMGRLARRLRKPVIVTEVGFRSAPDGAAKPALDVVQRMFRAACSQPRATPQNVAVSAARAPLPLPAQGDADGESARLTAIVGATLIDGTGADPLEDAVVLVQGERIEAVGSAASVDVPRGAKRIEARGRFIIPGLIDSHVHLAGAGRADRADRLLPHYLRWGVTTVRDVGSPLQPILALRAIVRAPHANGLPVTRHVPEDITVRAAIAAELNGIEHAEMLVWRSGRERIDTSGRRTQPGLANAYRPSRLNDPLTLEPDAERIRSLGASLASHGVVVDPTLVACEAVWATRLGAEPDRDVWLSLRAWQRHRRAWEATAPPFTGLTPVARARLANDAAAALHRLQRLIARLHADGVPIIAGTDSPGWTKPGSALHRELELLTEAGLSPMAVLLAATRNAAAALGEAADLGTVEEGKMADLVLLDADPLQSIRATARIHRVMKGGVLHDPQSLCCPSP